MRLSPEQTRQAWALFRNSALFAKWPGAFNQLDSLLEPAPIDSDGLIYEPGDAPTHLYLIGAGSVELSLMVKGKPALKHQLGPGDYFGQMGLFSREYRSRAVAAPGTVLYRMSAAMLRMALDQNPGLQEQLIHETRAGRLRRIPLFRDLSDGQVRWLAQVIQERDFAKGTRVPLESDAGLWIMDYGQVRVTGPANPHPETWKEWGITAGNFFFSPSPELRFGRKCVADSAATEVPSCLLFLPISAANQLIGTFSDMGEMVAAPLEIAELLATTELLQRLETRQQQHLAQHAAWEFVRRQNVTTQGSLGHSFVYVRDGAAVVTAVDERGRQRPRNYLSAGESYGTTSLLEGKPRDATVRAVKAPDTRNHAGLDGAELITLNREDVQYAFAADRQLWHREVSLVDQMVEVKEEKHPFDWMDEGEILRWRRQPHVLWLIIPEALVLLAGLLLIGLVMLIPEESRRAVGAAAAVCGMPALVLVAGIVLLNYLDDYYVLTNRRVTRRDRQLVLYEARTEAPLEMVQDVTISANFWGRLFGYGHVTVRTASKDRSITLANIPAPEEVKADILQGRIEAQAAGYGKQGEVLRRSLISNLQMALPIPERQRALGRSAEPPQSLPKKLFSRGAQAPKPSQERLPGTPRGQPQWLIAMSGRLPDRWSKVVVDPTKAPPKPLSGQIVWRKHWINMLARIGLPLIAVTLVLLLGIVLLAVLEAIPELSPMALFLPWLVALAATVFWLWWQYTDWHNDIYVLTDEKIIDIEMKPLGIDSKRREGSLERVQNVDAKQRGLTSVILDYGDVVISTAAGDEGYTFLMVPHPKKVQALVFQKLDALRRRQDEIKTQQRQRELIEGLQVYHQIQSEQASRSHNNY
jgi:CRP-like cAMP-binding protein/membrane protein YdbS with pleckstrin-like domain